MAQDTGTALKLLKVALGVTHNARDGYYDVMLHAALSELSGRGIALDITDDEDMMLLVDYAEFNYRSRDADRAMPRHLLYRLRNREAKGRADNEPA